jgi:hypothetical protein
MSRILGSAQQSVEHCASVAEKGYTAASTPRISDLDAGNAESAFVLAGRVWETAQRPSDHSDFSSPASFCASAICAGVICAATISRSFTAFSMPRAAAKLNHMCAVT